MVLVTFKDGRQASYTKAVYELLITDEDVIEIVDEETGEVLFWLA